MSLSRIAVGGGVGGVGCWEVLGNGDETSNDRRDKNGEII